MRERIPGAVLAALAVVGMTWLSRAPLSSTRTTDSVLRLAWRARPERIERCVAQSPEALAALPAHMRQPLVCEGISASYRLEVRRDGDVVADHLVTAGGLRRDRPLYVFFEIPLPEGEATIAVRFTRVEASAMQDAEQTLREELTEAVPAELTWERRLSSAPGQVHVLSYDPERRVLFEVQPN